MTGDELKNERLAQGLSRLALAALCNLLPDTVRYWERVPSLDANGHAVKLMVHALGLGPLSDPVLGNNCTATRARYGVLLDGMAQVPPLIPRSLLQCGAKTRRGTPCRCRPVPGKRRCKFHGGMSTGPKTEAGKQRISIAQKHRWQDYRSLATPN